MDPITLAVNDRLRRRTPIKVVQKPKTVVKTKTKVVPKAASQAVQDALEAAGLVETSIRPGITEIQDAIKAAGVDRTMQANATAGIIKALAGMTAGDAEAARAVYGDAGSRVAGYSGAIASALQQAAGQGQQLGAGAAGTPIATLAPAAVATQQAIGALPANQLTTDSASAFRNTQDVRYAGGARLAEAASQADYKAGADMVKLRDEIGKLEAKRPGLIAEALKDIQQARNAEQATRTQMGYLKLQQAKTLYDQADAKTDMTGMVWVVKNGKIVPTGQVAQGSDAYATAQRAADAAARVAATNAATDARTAAAAEQAVIARTNAATARMNAETTKRAAEIKAGQKDVTTAKDRATAEGKFRSNARKLATQLVGIVKAGQQKPLRFPPKKAQIVAQIYQSYGAQLAGLYGLTEAEIKSWATQIVNTFPQDWWNPKTYAGKKTTKTKTA